MKQIDQEELKRLCQKVVDARNTQDFTQAILDLEDLLDEEEGGNESED